MFNKGKIQAALVGIVGLRQPFNPEFAILDAANTDSRSGLFVTDNPFAKVEYLKETQDYAEISDADFNETLRNMQRSAIANVCSQVFSKAAYIDRNLLFKYAGAKVETDVLPDGFVGYRIRVCDEKNVAFTISRVLLDFAGTGVIDLMLFNTAKLAPLFTKEIEITSDHQSENLEWTVDNSGDTYKGEYYIGYISTGISVAPYTRNYENASVMSFLTYLEIDKVSVLNHATDQLFDVRKVGNMNEDTGLNLDITVNDDFTDLIIRNEQIFARAIYLDFIMSFLLSYATTARSNHTQRVTNEIVARAMLEIEGNKGEDSPITIPGLRPQFLREISQIKNEIDELRKGYFGGAIMVNTVD